jgi:DNA-binding transcriptional LysR family regulator
VVLTSFGQAALMRAKLISAELRNLESEIDALRSVSTGQVNVGIPSGVGFTSEVLPAATLAIATDQAQLEICYSIGTNQHLLASLRRGDLDFLVADMEPERDSTDLVQEVILRDQLGLFVQPKHPLAHRKRLRAAALAAYSWAVLSDSAALARMVRSALAQSGTPFSRNLMQSNSALFVRSMLAKTCAIGFLSRDATRPDVVRERLVELDLAPDELPPAPGRTIALVYRRGSVLSTAAQALAQKIREQVRALGKE